MLAQDCHEIAMAQSDEENETNKKLRTRRVIARAGVLRRPCDCGIPHQITKLFNGTARGCSAAQWNNIVLVVVHPADVK